MDKKQTLTEVPMLTFYRDSLEETIDAPAKSFRNRAGHTIEVYKVAGVRKFFVTLKNSSYCAHGNTIAEAVGDATWKNPQLRPSLEELRKKIIAAGTSRKISLNEFRTLTGACKAGCDEAIKAAGITASALTVKEITEQISQEWGTKLAQVLSITVEK